jgi:RHS repeat-associated protein
MVTPNGGSPVQSWKQTFTFDRYGNRNFDESQTTTLVKNCGTPPNQTVCPADVPVVNPSVNTANNRLNGYLYDAAGNTVRDAENRKFTYDGENKQVKVEMLDANGNPTSTIGEYFYDGDGKRVKKFVPSTGETTIFVYDASGKMLAEYSTIVEPPSTAKVSYLTTDHLGSPRILTDANGQLISRRDFHPFGEEIITAQRTQDLGYIADTIRQKFTGYERDVEIDLEFAQARMYQNQFGRFTSIDPIFFQLIMTVDPQRFNLYVYTRNNPLKWVDPLGEDVRIRGTNTIDSIYEMVGGQEEFDRYFTVTDGRVVLRPDVDISQANSGIQNLAGLVKALEVYLFYVGNNFNEIADLFEGAVNSRGDLTNLGKKLREEFEGSSTRIGGVGTLVGVRGRPGDNAQPANINGDQLFAVIAFNSDASIVQTGVSLETESWNSSTIVALEGQLNGLGQQVRASSFFIHEGAEAEAFSKIGFKTPFLGIDNYKRAHQTAMKKEEQIRRDLKLTGGFSGGDLTSSMPRRKN